MQPIMGAPETVIASNPFNNPQVGPVVDADVNAWDRMVQINILGLLYTTHGALPHLIAAAEQDPRRVADLISRRPRQVRFGAGPLSLHNRKEMCMELNAKFGFAELLKQIQAQKAHVGVYLRGGHVLTGSVLGVGDHFVVIGELDGKEFFDAQIRLDDISAIDTRTRNE